MSRFLKGWTSKSEIWTTSHVWEEISQNFVACDQESYKEPFTMHLDICWINQAESHFWLFSAKPKTNLSLRMQENYNKESGPNKSYIWFSTHSRQIKAKKNDNTWMFLKKKNWCIRSFEPWKFVLVRLPSLETRGRPKTNQWLNWEAPSTTYIHIPETSTKGYPVNQAKWLQGKSS